jgi:hypothetical protein
MDALSASIPLIGVWCKSLESMKDSGLIAFLISFISNKKYCKLETGKSQLLICHFPENSPSRPECFEVDYEV